MSYNEDEEVEDVFKMGGDEDEPLNMPLEDLDLGDDEDPENRYH
jgi:hypothetical protein